MRLAGSILAVVTCLAGASLADDASPEWIGAVIVDPSSGADAAPACPNEDRYVSFAAAIADQDWAKAERYIERFGCMVVYAEGHGEIRGASMTGNLFLIEMKWFSEDEYDAPVEVYLDAFDLRDMSGRDKGYLMELWKELNGI